MKFERWTVALAALGVVSLASAAKAEEKASSVMTALASTTLSGYVDTSAQWNFGTGNEFMPLYKFGGASKADGFNLNVVQLRIEKPLDEAEWAAGYRVDLWAGPDANTLGTQSIFGGGTSASQGDFALRQAYVALRTPIQNGIDWKIGVFDSIIGYESIESPNDPNYTRSYGHSIEPQTHTGILASYRFNDLLSASAGIANTIGPRINSRAFIPVPDAADNTYPESYKTYMGSIAITAPDSTGFLAGSTLYAGIVNGFNNSVGGSSLAMPTLNAYIGGTIATPVTGLRLGVAWDLLNMDSKPAGPDSKLEADLWSLAGYASYQATEKLSFHGRVEYLTGDVDKAVGVALPAGGIVPLVMDNAIYSVTATAQYDLWRNVISRLEFRWDHSEHGNMFGHADSVTGGPSRDNAFMLGANIIYKF